MLQQHQTQQDATKQARKTPGKNYSDQGLVFCWVDGVPFYPGTLNFYLAKALAKAGLPKFRMHYIRNTFASLMVAQGTSIKVVQELLGHATVQMTLDTYTHVLPGTKAAAVDKLQDFFKADSKPPEGEKSSPENSPITSQ